MLSRHCRVVLLGEQGVADVLNSAQCCPIAPKQKCWQVCRMNRSSSRKNNNRSRSSTTRRRNLINLGANALERYERGEEVSDFNRTIMIKALNKVNRIMKKFKKGEPLTASELRALDRFYATF